MNAAEGRARYLAHPPRMTTCGRWRKSRPHWLWVKMRLAHLHYNADHSTPNALNAASTGSEWKLVWNLANNSPGTDGISATLDMGSRMRFAPESPRL